MAEMYQPTLVIGLGGTGKKNYSGIEKNDCRELRAWII